jgi:hypothetical protein
MAAAFATSGERSTPDRDCDRLIALLQRESSAEAHEALQRMGVYRQANRYRACIATGAAQEPRSAGAEQLRVTQIVGLEIVNDDGVEIGEAERVVRGRDGRAYVVTTYRAPHRPGNTQVALPLERITLDAGRLVLPDIGEAELRAMSSVPSNSTEVTPIDDQESVSVGSAASPKQTGSTR